MKALVMARSTKTAPAVSASVHLILEQLEDLALSKTDFARQLGVSPDYVYRILKGRVPFPHVRETIERMAEILDLDPHAFGEYREMEQALSPSTRLVWQRMKELGLSREDLFQALGGRISRPYFNSILRGDQPFPANRSFIQLFALALDLPPGVFREFGRQSTSRWTDEQREALENEVLQLLFDKLLFDRGYAKGSLKLSLLDEKTVMAMFPASFSPELEAVLRRMGELGMGLVELEKVSSVPIETLRKLFTGQSKAGAAKRELSEIKQALRLD